MAISSDRIEGIIREAGLIALDSFKNIKNLQISKKSPRDFVTEADIAVETFLKDRLKAEYPDIGFWGEESGQSAFQQNRWIVDPIDGTHSFAKGQYYWSISAALEIDGKITMGAVYAPVFQDYYAAEKGRGAFKNGRSIAVSGETRLADAMVGTGFACLRNLSKNNNLQRFCRIAENTTGQRRLGSAALDLCLLAEGQLDAYWEQELNLYDVAAGALIAAEAGATLTDFKGREGLFPEQVLATNGKLLSQILPLM